MQFDVAALDAAVCARLVTGTVIPRPIAWIVTVSSEGVRNAAPFSFFNAVCSWPPILAIGMQSRRDGNPKDTLTNIRATGEFVVNLVPRHLTEAMSTTGSEVEPEVDEIALAGLMCAKSSHVAVPRLAGAPAAFECRTRQIIDIEAGRVVVMGDVIAIHVDDAAIVDRQTGYIDATALDLVARIHGADHYATTRDRFTVPRG
jgi:flavin reductase (DIM6/NTAB) family NADH-FMN oxidoreductase RutF